MFFNLISKTWPVVVGLCVIFIFFIVGYEAADCKNPVMWEAIPEDQYDRNSSSVRLGMRPLGFKDDVLPYSPDGLPNPCYRIEGTNGKRIEIMAETHGGLNAKLCVRTQRQDHGCDDGKLYNCEQANANYLNIEFYCDTNGCDQSDTTIWIRFVVSPDEYDNDPEMFCLDRNADEYPSSLIQIPPPSQKPIIPTTDTGRYEAADCENPVMWEAIPEDQYDRNSSSVRLGMRPLGFKDDVLPYSPDGLPNPCYTVEGTDGKRVEIMAETHGGLNAKLCVRTQRQDHGCDDGKLYNCEQANATYLNIEFYCDTNGCDQSDTTIWIRFVVSPDEYDNDPEMFCLDRNADEYPSSLIQIPPPSQKPIIPTTDTGSTLKATLTLLIVSYLIAIGIRFG